MPASPPLPPDPTRAPSGLSPDERRREIAMLLARGVLRLRRSRVEVCGLRPVNPASTLTPQTSNLPLDVHAGTRLHVVDRTACRQAADAGKERQL